MPKLKFFPYCTEYASQYWSYPHCTDLSPLRVLMLSPNVLNTLHSTEAIPHCIDVIPTVLKVSPTCTAVILPQHWRYPSTVLNLSPQYWSSTEGIPPQYWIPSTMLMLSPQYWCYLLHVLPYPPLCWTTSTVLNLSPQYWSFPPTVLNNHHSTEAIPTVLKLTLTVLRLTPTALKLSPTVLMLSPDALNNLRSTEPMLYGVINWLGAGLVSFAKNWQHKIFSSQQLFWPHQSYRNMFMDFQWTLFCVSMGSYLS